MGDRSSYVFLDADGHESATLTFAELERRARAIGQEILRHAEPGDRVLLLHPAGLDYVASFYGCVAAGVIGVPLFPPQRSKIDNVEVIANDCDAAAVVTTSAVAAGMDDLDAALTIATLPRIAADAVPDTDPALPEHDTDILYLQYTSGSTAVPKGVIVDNTMAFEQCANLVVGWDVDAESRVVSWLPHFHDFGQLSSVLLPIYVGIQTVVMAPSTFVKNPVRWLDAVTKYRGTHCGSPNFAFDLCVDKVTPQQREQLDLSSWKLVANGAEPVRPATMDRFQEAFAPHGLSDSALSPGYGLAEATLKISCSPPGVPYVTHDFDSAALGRRDVAAADGGGSTRLAGNGNIVRDTQLAIVDPETSQRVAADQLGELWVRGPIVSPGYWNRPEETEKAFRARISGGDDDEFWLRTGDLGFVYDDNIFICGRVKNLMIVNGVNYYLEDIETTVVESHEALRFGSVVAFAVQRDGLDRLVVVAEHRDEENHPSEKLISKVYDALARTHSISPEAIVLTAPGSVPRTTSGKLRRQHCRDDYLADRLNVVHRWTEATSLPETQENEMDKTDAPAPSAAMSMRDLLHTGLRAHVADWVRRNLAAGGEYDGSRSLAEHGLGSVDQMALHEELEKWSGRRFPPELMWDAESIDDMTLLIADHVAGARDEVSTRVGA